MTTEILRAILACSFPFIWTGIFSGVLCLAARHDRKSA